MNCCFFLWEGVGHVSWLLYQQFGLVIHHELQTIRNYQKKVVLFFKYFEDERELFLLYHKCEKSQGKNMRDILREEMTGCFLLFQQINIMDKNDQVSWMEYIIQNCCVGLIKTLLYQLFHDCATVFLDIQMK